MGVKISTSTILGSVIPAVVSVGDGTIIYAFFFSTDAYTLYVFKSTNSGSSWSLISSVSNTTIHGTSTTFMDGISAALDSAGYIHVVSSPYSLDTRDYSYNTLNTSNNSWGTWAECAALTAATNSYNAASIAVDSNDKPHVLFLDSVTSMGSAYTRVKYTNKVSGSWLAPETVDAEASSYHSYPVIAMGPSNVVNAWYNEGTTPAGRYRARTSSWGTAGSYTGKYPNSLRSLTVTSGSVVYRYGSTASPYVINENGVQINNTSGSLAGQDVEAALTGSTKVVVYKAGSSGLRYVTCPTSGSVWSTPIVQESGTIYDFATEWAYNHEKQPSSIIRVVYAYYESPNYYPYYTAIDTRVTGAVTSQHAYMNAVVGARTNPKWWIPTSGSCPPVVFAYQAIRTLSQADSFKNLDNPGTNDASLGTIASWNGEIGWTFDPIDYLNTGWTPTSGSVTIIARYVWNPSAFDETTMYGADTAYGGSTLKFRVYLTNMYWYNQGRSYSTARANSGVIAMAGWRCFLNGTFKGAMTPGSGYTYGPFFIGKETTTPTYTNYAWDGSISVFAVYDGILTDQQVAEVSAAMLDMPEPFHGFPQHAYMVGTGGLQRGVQHALLNSAIPITPASIHAYMRGDYAALWPDSDIARTGDWQDELARTVGIYQSIDEWPVIDDNDFIIDITPSAGEYYECGLTDPIGPIGTGNVTVKYRGKSTSGSYAATVHLRQGSSTVISSGSALFTPTPTIYEFTLSAGEKASITDWTDLRLRFIVGVP